MKTPRFKKNTQQVILCYGRNSHRSCKIDFIRQHEASLEEDNELASKIISQMFNKFSDELCHQELAPALVDDDKSNTPSATLAKNDKPDDGVVLQEGSESVVMESMLPTIVSFLRDDELPQNSQCNCEVYDQHKHSHNFVINIERQIMVMPNTIPQPIMIQIKPNDTKGVGLIDPSGVGSLELASDISKMVSFYAQKAVDELGKARNHRGDHIQKEELAFHMESFADDIYEFAKDASSTSLSINMGMINNRNEISQVQINIDRTTEWRNPI